MFFGAMRSLTRETVGYSVISTRILIFVQGSPPIVDGTTVLVNITMTVPQPKEIEDALSNSWGVVCLAGISDACGLLAVRTVLKS